MSNPSSNHARPSGSASNGHLSIVDDNELSSHVQAAASESFTAHLVRSIYGPTWTSTTAQRDRAFTFGIF